MVVSIRASLARGDFSFRVVAKLKSMFQSAPLLREATIRLKAEAEAREFQSAPLLREATGAIGRKTPMA